MKSAFIIKIILAIILMITQKNVLAQDSHNPYYEEKPAIVVGVIVDQMRPDYIDRYWDMLGDDGFKRLVNQGFTFSHAKFDYMPTATGAGHAGVYAGTTPSEHGAIGNSWYVRELGRDMNVIEVPGYAGVGSASGYNGSKGPGNLLTTTFGDELRLHTNKRSKVVSMSRKDRGAILPSGHLGDAYWYEASTGNFVTSTFYHEELPEWVGVFNSLNLAQAFLSEPWKTLHPIENYTASIDDDNPYERRFVEEVPPVFPHNLPMLVEKYGMDPGLLSYTAFSDELLLEFAFAAIEGESLGIRDVTDILSISFSALDGVGHMFGPASVEVQDTFLRLDALISRLLNHLDEQVGEENYLLFLTSDHGAPHVPEYLTDLGIPGGYVNLNEEEKSIRGFISETWGADFLLAISNFQLYFDHDVMIELGLDHGEIQTRVARFVLHREGVSGVLTADALTFNEFTKGIRGWVQKGYHQQRSGDVMFWLKPHTNRGTEYRGTDHNSPWVYDTHAPMHWYGWTVKPGRSTETVYISDIASTVTNFLGSPLPSGNTGHPMNRYLK
jgi:predicted AlkP superfamily pyrophosphatase or phosphodiesterase